MKRSEIIRNDANNGTLTKTGSEVVQMAWRWHGEVVPLLSYNEDITHRKVEKCNEKMVSLFWGKILNILVVFPMNFLKTLYLLAGDVTSLPRLGDSPTDTEDVRTQNQPQSKIQQCKLKSHMLSLVGKSSRQASREDAFEYTGKLTTPPKISQRRKLNVDRKCHQSRENTERGKVTGFQSRKEDRSRCTADSWDPSTPLRNTASHESLFFSCNLESCGQEQKAPFCLRLDPGLRNGSKPLTQ